MCELCIELYMKAILFCSISLMLITGCSPEKRSPDAIRDETAKATSTAARDAKAVAQGVVDGLREKGPVNINKDSAAEIQKLPGIDGPTAQKIVDGRPYGESNELVKRHIVSKAEYDHIAGKITVH